VSQKGYDLLIFIDFLYFFHLFTPPIFYCTKKTGVFEREKQRGAFAWRAWLAEARTGESDPLSDRDEESKI